MPAARAWARRWLGPGLALALGTLLLAMGLALPLVLRWWVLAPNALAESGWNGQIFRGEYVNDQPWQTGRLPAGAQVDLAHAHTTLVARGLWRVERDQAVRLSLTADDYASLSLDGRVVLELPPGVSAGNRGAASLEVAAGPHLITVTLHNGPGAGYFRLLAAAPAGLVGQPRDAVAGEAYLRLYGLAWQVEPRDLMTAAGVGRPAFMITTLPAWLGGKLAIGGFQARVRDLGPPGSGYQVLRVEPTRQAGADAIW